jgi:hypothetical protein
MAYCAVPAILRASRMAVRGTERVTGANAAILRSRKMFVFPIFYLTVYIPLFATVLSFVGDRLVRSLRQINAHLWLPAIAPQQRFVRP